MPKSFSATRSRNEAMFAHWDTRDDSVFSSLGLTRDQVTAAQKKLSGTIVLPGDPSYDTDRMLVNPIFNPSPSMIVYCHTESDVAVALGMSADGNMPFTVRSGGHCTAGYSSGAGVLIDVSNLNLIYVDTTHEQAVVGAGTQFGDLNKELEHHGMHTPGGECSSVCIGGYVQGGGIGFTSTTFGMNCDNVRAMRVMLADGSTVECSKDQNADLWWAMRGGTGGNFGILLTVTYTIYKLEDVFGWALAWPMTTDEEIAVCTNVMAILQDDYMTNLKYGKQLTTQMLLCYQTIIDPCKPPLPEPVPVFMVRGLWVGDEASGADSMGPFLNMAGCVTQLSMTGPYTEVLEQLLDYPQEQPPFPAELGEPFEDKASRYVERDLTSEEWTSILKMFRDEAPNHYTYMYLEIYGGEISNWTPEDNAFVHRNVHFDAVMDVYWFLNKDRPENDAFLQKWIDLMETVWSKAVYQNYCSVNVPDYKWNYWKEALPGLVGTKKKYDPKRKFQFAQMVPYEVPADYPTHEVPANVAAALAEPIDYTGGRELKRDKG
jgi:hypothetical protein